MADFGFLSNPASAQVQSPDLLRMAGQAMTLGSMAQQQQLQQLAIQKQQLLAQAYADPDVMQAYSQILGQGGQGGVPNLSAVSKYGIAAPDILGGILGTAEKAAQMQKDLAAAGYSKQQTQDLQLTLVQRLAAQGAPAPIVANELKLAGVDPNKFYDPSNPGGYVDNVANSLLDPKVKQQLLLAPQELAVKQGELAQKQAEFYGGKAFQDPTDKSWWVQIPKKDGGFIIQPASVSGVPAQPAPVGGVNVQQAGGGGQPAINVQGATPGEVAFMNADIASGGNVFKPVSPSAPTAPSAAVRTNAQGAPVTGPGLAEQKQIENNASMQADVVKDSSVKIANDQHILQIVPPLKKLIASGYNGPLARSDAGSQWLALVSQYGLASPDTIQRWGEMRASEVFSQDLLGAVMKEYGQRGGIQIAKVAQLGKPGAQNDVWSRMDMTNAIETEARNDLALHQGKVNYVRAHLNDDPAAANYQPPAPAMAPQLKVPNDLAISALRHSVQAGGMLPNGRDPVTEFENHFGPGTAAIALGGALNPQPQ